MHSSSRKVTKNCSLEGDLIEFSYISIFYHNLKDFQAHPSFSTEIINSIKKQGKPQVFFVLFTLQNRQNDLHKSSKNNLNKVQLSLIFINWVKIKHLKSMT